MDRMFFLIVFLRTPELDFCRVSVMVKRVVHSASEGSSAMSGSGRSGKRASGIEGSVTFWLCCAAVVFAFSA